MRPMIPVPAYPDHRTTNVSTIRAALFRVFPELLEPRGKITIGVQSEPRASDAPLSLQAIETVLGLARTIDDVDDTESAICDSRASI